MKRMQQHKKELVYYSISKNFKYKLWKRNEDLLDFEVWDRTEVVRFWVVSLFLVESGIFVDSRKDPETRENLEPEKNPDSRFLACKITR